MRILALVLLLIGCDNKTVYETVTKESVQEVEINKAEKFDGTFYLPHQGQITLDERDGLVDISNYNQFIFSENPENSTLATHPTISMRGLPVSDDKVRFVRDYNYTTKNDIEEDVSGSNITGKKKTDYTLELDKNSCLKINIKIWSGAIKDNPNFLIAERNLVGC